MINLKNVLNLHGLWYSKWPAQLGPLVNEFLTVLKTLYYSPRKLKNTGKKLLEKTKKNVNISGYSEKFFKPLKNRSSWVQAG